MTDEVQKDTNYGHQETEQGTEQSQVTQEAPKVSPSEERALKMGWKPKDDFVKDGGDPDEWRSAREFLDRGELIGKVMASQRELAEVKRALQFMSDHQQKQFMAGYQKAIDELKQQRNDALEEGNLKQAQEISDKIDEHKENLRQVKQQAAQPQYTGPSEDFKNWSTRNDWYGKDPVLTRYANSLGLSFKETNPNSVETEMLDYVEKEVRKEFKHKFTPKAAPNPDGNGRQASRAGNSGGVNSKLAEVEKNLQPHEIEIMNTMIKQVKGMTKERYLREYSGLKD